LLAIAIAINLKFVIREYAWADDWSFFGGYHNLSPRVDQEHLIGYRPLLQIIFDYSWPYLNSIDGLKVFRCIAVIGISLLSFLMYRIFSELGYGKFLSLSIAFSLYFLPTFQIYQKWATAFPYSWCALISLLAWIANRKSHIALSVIFLIVAFLTYQPAATFGLVAVLAETVKKKKVCRQNKTFILQTIFAFVFATIFARLLLLVMNIEPKLRADIIDSPSEFLAKINWVISRPLVLMFRPFLFDSPELYEILILIPVVTMIHFALWNKVKKLREYIQLLAQVGLILVLMLLPLLPIRENQIEFRVLPSTSIAGVFLILFAFEILIGRIKLFRQAVISFACIALVSIGLYVDRKSEEIFIDSYVTTKEFILENSKDIGGGVLNYQLTYDGWPMRDYVGAPSAIYDLQMSWVIEPMLKTLLIDRFNVFNRISPEESADKKVLNLDVLKEMHTARN